MTVVDPLPETAPTDPGGAADRPEDADQWSAKLRSAAVEALPPDRLLPDRQPAYVASWIYVFGVAALAALGIAIVSGFAIALGGPDWWHYNPVGHFFNSLHMWSVEMFMALLVIHLWGKFWMAAWRGRRTATWITGVVAFVASVVECFTGYLSQQNFDSQWISTSAKDAFNSTGLGAQFDAMNFGQMLLWHVVLIPIVLVALVGGWWIVGVAFAIHVLMTAVVVATIVSVMVVAVELAAISYIRYRYMDTPFLAATFQIVVGGVLVFLAGILIGSS